MMVLESYAHVHHIVSNIKGRLRHDVKPGQAIAAVFPGGTITGCPKVRCMEIIAELEQGPRGAYTGSFGYLNRDGSLDLNILIRTMVKRGNRTHASRRVRHCRGLGPGRRAGGDPGEGQGNVEGVGAMSRWYHDGEPLDVVSIDDRAFQYGDGLFETIAIRNGGPRLWDYHMERLAQGCERLQIRMPDVREPAKPAGRCSWPKATRSLPIVP